MKPTDILRFFNTNNAKIDSSKKAKPYSLEDYIKSLDKKEHKDFDIVKLNSICKKFENEGLLISAGSTGRSPLLHQCYYNWGYNEEMAEYGAYDFLINGFLDIRNTFSSSVLPIVVQNNTTKKIDIGTSFIISDNSILTARHCIESMDIIKILRNNNTIPLESILFPKNNKIDLAVVITEKPVFTNVKKFKFDDGKILDEVLTLGYPPVSGFDAIQFSEKGTISTTFKASTGNLVGEDKSYLDGVDYFLINARVKGGNSGGPVINKLGCVIGMLTQLPVDNENPNRVDLLGFGIALPTKSILDTLDNNELEEFKGKNNDDGFNINWT